MSALLDAHLAERDDGVVEQGVRIDPSIAERLPTLTRARRWRRARRYEVGAKPTLEKGEGKKRL